MTTFIDLAAHGDQRLVDASARIGTLPEAEAADAARELAVLARTCRRILDDVLDAQPPSGTTHPGAGPLWIRAAQQAYPSIRRATRDLTHAADTYTRTNDTPRAAGRGPVPPLHSAVRQLCAGEEFLQIHLRAPSGGILDPKSTAEIGDARAARELVALVGRWAGLLGNIATPLSREVQVPRRTALINAEPLSTLLNRAGSCAHEAHTTIHQTIGAPRHPQAILALLPDPPMTTAGQTPANETLGLAEHAATRVHHTIANTQHDETPSVATLRSTAIAASRIHDNAAIVAQQLAARVAELPGTPRPDHRSLTKAADALSEAGCAWRSVARQLDTITMADDRLSTAAVQVTDVALHMRNAAFSDPGAAPAALPTALRPPAELAPDPPSLISASGHLSGVATELGGIATAHRATLRTHQAAGRLVQRTGGQRTAPADGEIATLTRAYEQARRHGRRAANLIGTRATADAKREPAAAPTLARSGFPHTPGPGGETANTRLRASPHRQEPKNIQPGNTR